MTTCAEFSDIRFGYCLNRHILRSSNVIAFLLAIVVGSGIMAERLAGGNVALSGAHFNPTVTLSEAWQKNLPAPEVLPNIGAQIFGAFAGVVAAHLMFGDPVFIKSQHVRTGGAQWRSEFVATFGLIAVIIGCSRSRPSVTPFAVAAYITSVYWFTLSTSFANPAVTLARSATDTFAGIRPGVAPGFIVAQLLGASAATLLFCWLYPPAPVDATVGSIVAPSDFAAIQEKTLS